MRRTLVYSFLISTVVMSSCKTTRKNIQTDGPFNINTVDEASAMLENVKGTDISYTWFRGEGTGTIDWEGERYSAKMRIRIERHKTIWVQIQKFGFEIGRMLINQDSAFIINRLERSYSAYNTKEFSKKYNLPADFEMMSKVFTGGAYIPEVITKAEIHDDHSLYLESGSGVTATHWLDGSNILVRSMITDPLKREWSAGFSNYMETNTGQKFPFKRTNSIVIDGESNVFDLEYSDIEIDIPQEFPFSIPSHYDKL